jgi:hypothetical protein
MANLQEIKGTVSARLGYEDDFTFEKKKEELAQLVRSDVAPRISKLLGGGPAKVSIDSDGDIAVQMKDAGYIYLTSTGATCSALNIALSQISTATSVRLLPDVIGELHQLRSGYLKPIAYALRVFATFWYPNASSVENLRSHFFPRFCELSESNITSLSSNLSYVEGPFSDRLELDTKVEQVAVRFMRDAEVSEFANFADFWDKAKIGEVAGKLSPFLEPLDRAEMGSIGRLFGSAAAEK